MAQNEEEADVVLTVEIQRYTNAPSSISGEERAAKERLERATRMEEMIAQFDNQIGSVIETLAAAAIGQALNAPLIVPALR